ncbi:MAG: hypothetical protein ABF820_01215, partial [Sporolactobacillus sp.]
YRVGRFVYRVAAFVYRVGALVYRVGAIASFKKIYKIAKESESKRISTLAHLNFQKNTLTK